MKQEALGAMVGLSNASISDYERGLTEPSVENLLRFSEIFNVTIEELLGSESKPVADDPGVYVTGNVGMARPNIDEFYTRIPFLSARAQAGIPHMLYEHSDVRWITETYPVFMPLVTINERHIVIEVAGDSMEPELRPGTVVLAEQIHPNNWQYESGGIYAVLYGPGRFVIKRIKTNEIAREGVLWLHSDNERYHGKIEVKAAEIHQMWKILLKVKEEVR
jgi:transcriptional regulator with XRE-family HTH domain